MEQEPDLATIAALLGDATRATILAALMGGEALPASELAYRAHITPQTASSHLSKLLHGGLIKVTPNGRHRYYALKNREVAQLLETLQLVAPMRQSPIKRPSKVSEELCEARTCYDHLAGQLGVAVRQALIHKNYLIDNEEQYSLTPDGIAWLASVEIDVDKLQKKRRKFAYPCLDWSERQFHIGGSLGAAIANLFFEKQWVQRKSHTRALHITSLGKHYLYSEFAMDFSANTD